jgi:PAS domain S-box-containing protein
VTRVAPGGERVDAALLEESVEELYEQAPAGYLSSLPGGLIVKVNETLLAWTGWAREDLVGAKRLQDLLAPGARIYYETHYAPLLAMQGAVREIAVELVRADGGRLPVLLNSTLVRDADGVPRVVRTTVFDASERRRYERELQRLRADAESRARAALALTHVHDGVLLVSADGVVELVNPAAERILGIDAAVAVGRALAEAVAGWAEATQDARAGVPSVVPYGAADHEQWLAVVREDAGPGGVVWSFRDVTADRALEQLRGDVIAVVSHELRTPLTGVYGSAQTLLARYDELPDETRRELLRVLVEQADRLARLVDRILLTSRLDAGAVEDAVDVADAGAVAEAALSTLSEADRRRVVVTVADGRVRGGDSARQVVSNLLENALKYSDGPVRLDVERAGDLVRFVVADEGPGVPLAEHERIFEKFYRVDPGQLGGVGGVGLGLYIARRLAEALGGRVQLLPAARGTTIAVELPVVGSRA